MTAEATTVMASATAYGGGGDDDDGTTEERWNVEPEDDDDRAHGVTERVAIQDAPITASLGLGGADVVLDEDLENRTSHESAEERDAEHRQGRHRQDEADWIGKHRPRRDAARW